MYAVDASTGDLVWRFTTDTDFYSSPAISNGVVYNGDSRTFYALKAATGAMLWNYTGDGDSFNSSPVISGGIVYAGRDDNKLYAFNASSGELVWTYSTGNYVESSPALSDGRVYVGSEDRKVYALNATNGATLWSYTTGGGISASSPAVSNGVLYVGSNDDKVYALNATSGTLIWSYTTGDTVLSSPAVANGTAYVGSDDGNAYALNDATGALLWKYATNGRVRSSPAISGSTLYVGSTDNKLYALDATKGILLWSYTTGGSIDLSSPAITSGFVYVGSEDGNMYAFKSELHIDWPVFRENLSHTGVASETVSTPLQLKWTYKTGYASTSGIWSSPAVSEGILYVGSDDGTLYAINATDGRLVWSTDNYGNIRSSPSVSGGLVYVGAGNGLRAFDAFDGTVVWTYTISGGGVYSSPAVSRGIVYTGSFDNNTYALNATSGKLIWRYATGGPIGFSSPVVVGDIVYVGSHDGKLYALDSRLGTKLWSYATGGLIDSSPAVSDGNVYVGSADENVYALNAEDGSLVWKYKTGDAVFSSPAVSKGILYVGSGDRNLYALNALTGALLWKYTTRGAVVSSPSLSGNTLFFGSSDGNLYALNAANGVRLWNYTTAGSIVFSSTAVSDGNVYVGSLDGKVYAFTTWTIWDLVKPYTLDFEFVTIALIAAVAAIIVYPMTKSEARSKFMEMAVAEAMKSVSEDSRPHPKVGVVIVKDGSIQATAFRGESPGSHAEYTALEKKSSGIDLSGATLYTTLEPCTTRNHPKIPCARRVIERQIGKVVIGILDPNPRIRGRGVWDLKQAGIVIEFFTKEYEEKITEINKEFISNALKLSKKQNPFNIASIGDANLDKVGLSYRRISIVPVGETTEIIAPSTENDNWLDENRPNLIFGFPKPTEYGVEFEIHGHSTFAAVSRVGELYYGEAISNPVALDIGETIRLVGRMLKYAAAIYQRFPFRGHLTIEYRLLLTKQMELTLSETLERLRVLGNATHKVNPGQTLTKREIDTEDLTDLHGQASLLVNDLLRAFQLSVSTPSIIDLVKKYS